MMKAEVIKMYQVMAASGGLKDKDYLKRYENRNKVKNTKAKTLNLSMVKVANN